MAAWGCPGVGCEVVWLWQRGAAQVCGVRLCGSGSVGLSRCGARGCLAVCVRVSGSD